jgi:glutamate-ammonia-ligase adenylyltransferase
MPSLSFLTDNAALPKPAEPERARRELDMWRHEAEARSGGEADLARFMLDLADGGDGREFLCAIFGNSPFLSQSLRHDPAILQKVTMQGFDRTFEEMLTALADRQLWRHGRAEVMSGLRLAKRRVALTIAMADIAGAWPLEKVCRSLSRFAELSISIALNFLLVQAEKSGQLALSDAKNPESGSGIVVLGVGKLGARELNYSSDIDLLVLFDG